MKCRRHRIRVIQTHRHDIAFPRRILPAIGQGRPAPTAEATDDAGRRHIIDRHPAYVAKTRILHPNKWKPRRRRNPPAGLAMADPATDHLPLDHIAHVPAKTSPFHLSLQHQPVRSPARSSDPSGTPPCPFPAMTHGRDRMRKPENHAEERSITAACYPHTAPATASQHPAAWAQSSSTDIPRTQASPRARAEADEHSPPAPQRPHTAKSSASSSSPHPDQSRITCADDGMVSAPHISAPVPTARFYDGTGGDIKEEWTAEHWFAWHLSRPVKARQPILIIETVAAEYCLNQRRLSELKTGKRKTFRDKRPKSPSKN